MKGKVKMIKAIKNFIDNNLFILLQLLKISLILAYSIFLIIFFSNKMKKTVEEKNNTIIEQNVIQNNEIKEVTNEISSENTRAEENTSETTSRSNTEERTKTSTINTKKKTKKTEITSNNKGYIKFTATGYCPCKKCCGKTTGITASGEKAKAGVTVAMPSTYKFGTKIEIKGMGTYIVQDRGGAIKNKKIDIFFNTHTEALKFGKKTVYLKIVK